MDRCGRREPPVFVIDISWASGSGLRIDAARSGGGAALSAGWRDWPLYGLVPGAGLALAVGRGRNSLRRRVAVLPTARLPGALACDRPVAVLDPEYFCRLAAGGRSAVADLLPPPFHCGAACSKTDPVARRLARVCPALCRRRGRDPVFPRSRLACRRRARGGAGICLRRLGRVPPPAHRPDRKPRLSAARAVDAGAGAQALVLARRCRRRRV